jgi:glycosyltransferase involved in cell wall biosynthesis
VGDGPPEISILMPAYDEQATIAAAIERVLAAELPVETRELIVVENGSTDGTRAELLGREWPAEVRTVCLDRNLGKGGAVREALRHASGRLAVIFDADLEYEAADLAVVLEPLLSGEAEAVIGTRIFKSHSAYGFWYVLGNRLINTAANALYDAWLSDVLNCVKAMPTDLFRSLALRESGFGIDAEITARLLRSGVRVYEVPVNYAARSREEGKKLTAADGLRILATLIRCRFD